MANKFHIGIVLIFAAAFPRCTTAGNITTVKKLIIDTDAGGDDAVGILMASHAERLNDGPTIVGITCVNGNTDVEQVALNVLKTLKVADRLDIPVYVGAAHPLLLPNKQDYYFGIDGLGDFDFPDPPSTDLIQSKHAVNVMIDLVKEYPGEVTLLALGPLTNIALAIRMYPKFLDEVQQIIIMGGSTEGRGNARPGIEFNSAADPEANYVVLNSSNSNHVILASIESTDRSRVTRDFILSVINGTDYGWFIQNAAASTFESTDGYWYCADAVTTAIALTSGSIVNQSNSYHSEAIYDGTQTRGMIVVDYTNITGTAANTNIIQNFDVKVYKELLLRHLTSSTKGQRIGISKTSRFNHRTGNRNTRSPLFLHERT